MAKLLPGRYEGIQQADDGGQYHEKESDEVEQQIDGGADTELRPRVVDLHQLLMVDMLQLHLGKLRTTTQATGVQMIARRHSRVARVTHFLALTSKVYTTT